MATRFAYLSQGKLYLKSDDEPPVLYDSTFVEGMRDRAAQLFRRNSWKSGGTEGRMISRSALWGADARDPALFRVQFNAIAPRGERDGFLYSITSPEISGVLARKEDTAAELRLLHTADFRVQQIASQPGTGRLAMSVKHHACTVLATMNGDGGGLVEVTQGDSFDESPSWVPGRESEILFQSAGVAHNEQGAEVGLSPYALRVLNLETLKMTSLLEDPKRDLLSPKLAEDGSLLFIRRPYTLAHTPRSFWRVIEDILLFPYRLLYAFFQFLNLFTMMYTGKPLAHSGPFAKKPADQAQMVIWGNLVEARKSFFGDDGKKQGLVPASWELCRKKPDGEVEVFARSVLSFDLESDGGILYSNGAAIFRLSPQGEKEQIHKAPMIQQVVALPPSPSPSTSASLVNEGFTPANL